MGDTSLAISLCVADTLKTRDELQKKRISQFDNEIEILMCPDEFRSSRAGNVSCEKDGSISLGCLAKLKQKMYWNKANYIMSLRKIEQLQTESYFLEDVLAAISSNSDNIKWTFAREEEEYPFANNLFKTFEMPYYSKIQPVLFKFLGAVFGVISLLSYLGVLGSIKGVPLNTSPYFVAVHDQGTSGSGITIFVLLTLGYASYVTMWALFQMNISGVMELVGNKGTWPVSMSFNARMVARLASPLAFFYLGWIHENQIISGDFENASNGTPLYTAFSRFYQIQVIPIMGNSFNTLFPILMICVSLLTATNILNRIFVAIKCPRLQFGQTFISEEVLKTGKIKLAEKKKFLLRAHERGIFKDKLNIGKGVERNPDSVNYEPEPEIEEGIASKIIAPFKFRNGFGNSFGSVMTQEPQPQKKEMVLTHLSSIIVQIQTM